MEKMVIKLVSVIRGLMDKYFITKASRQEWKLLSDGIEIKRLTKSQKSEIVEYYHRLTGKRVKTKWHKLFYTLTGEFNVSYVPFEIYDDLKYKLSPWKYAKVLDDKNTYRQLFSGFILPERIVECINGIFYLPLISEIEVSAEEVFAYCRNIGECVIKPSKSSSAGNGVKLISVIDGQVGGANLKIL